MFFFFFQAEDGIRDYKVTGVQTCALPILALLRAPGARLVALEEKVRAVVVVGIRAVLALKHEIGVLVGFRLRRLDVGAARQRHQVRMVIVVAVVLGWGHRVLQQHRSPGPYDFGQFHREDVGGDDSGRLRVRRRDRRQALANRARRAESVPSYENGSDYRVAHTASLSGLDNSTRGGRYIRGVTP